MIDLNRLSVIQNEYQGNYKRVLCVCSGGVLRSPTAARVLSMVPFNCNTRAAGTEDYALVKVDEALLCWSEEIVCMTDDHKGKLALQLARHSMERPITCLLIPDEFEYRDPLLVKLIESRYRAAHV